MAKEIRRVLMDLEITGNCPVVMLEGEDEEEVFPDCDENCGQCGMWIDPAFRKGDILILNDDNTAGIIRKPDANTAAGCPTVSETHSHASR